MTKKDQINAVEYWQNYTKHLSEALADCDKNTIIDFAQVLMKALSSGNTIFVCGNGGSSAISSHFVCDFLKGVRLGNSIKPRFISLTDNTPVISAIANDISYDDIFSYQIESLGNKGDILISISSSGNSENIVRAIKAAKVLSMTTCAFTGFNGGRSRKLADQNIHIQSENYGIIEDCHHILMHYLSQYLRDTFANNNQP